MKIQTLAQTTALLLAYPEVIANRPLWFTMLRAKSLDKRFLNTRLGSCESGCLKN